jgi:hypothetical protein
MSITKFLGTLLAPTSTILSGPALRIRDSPISTIEQCTNKHLPTEEIYMQGIAQYCNNHFKTGSTFHDKDEVVVTIQLRNKGGDPIDWIYKIRWEDSSSISEGPIEIRSKTCLEKFNVWPEGRTEVGLDATYCMDGDTKLILGGKYVAGGSSLVKNLNREGSKLWIETRQKK